MLKVPGMGVVPAIMLAGAVCAAQGPSFNGTWKLNLTKSQLGGQTVTIEKSPSGVMHFDTEGFGYDFDLAGKEYPTPDGGTTAWRAVDATTWEATNRANGKVIATYRMLLKGNTITSVMKVTKPDGGAAEQTATFSRMSAGSGFLGKWKSTKVNGAATSMVLATDGTNGITVTFPEFQLVCKGNFDGKDYTVSGAGANLKQTFAFERTGPTSLKMTTKLSGKPFYVDVMTVSGDSKTLTDNGNSVSVNEPIKAVYERQ
jgi:hypothetical protein